ncbi:hypothetical protein K7H91_08860 [Martelella mediterranea]|uniref:hypothetical protein n=1 Tax=Martelella mediterranea TaxID=293089 RepID=UPI001E466EEB|nr:hypothetical protein [Martelella mediterranea]MCD1633880.1 hypothetical protein [Martelella mediterranea]
MKATQTGPLLYGYPGQIANSGGFFQYTSNANNYNPTPMSFNVTFPDGTPAIGCKVRWTGNSPAGTETYTGVYPINDGYVDAQGLASAWIIPGEGNPLISVTSESDPQTTLATSQLHAFSSSPPPPVSWTTAPIFVSFYLPDQPHIDGYQVTLYPEGSEQLNISNDFILFSNFEFARSASSIYLSLPESMLAENQLDLVKTGPYTKEKASYSPDNDMGPHVSFDFSLAKGFPDERDDIKIVTKNESGVGYTYIYIKTNAPVIDPNGGSNVHIDDYVLFVAVPIIIPFNQQSMNIEQFYGSSGSSCFDNQPLYSKFTNISYHVIGDDSSTWRKPTLANVDLGYPFPPKGWLCALGGIDISQDYLHFSTGNISQISGLSPLMPSAGRISYENGQRMPYSSAQQTQRYMINPSPFLAFTLKVSNQGQTYYAKGADLHDATTTPEIKLSQFPSSDRTIYVALPANYKYVQAMVNPGGKLCPGTNISMEAVGSMEINDKQYDNVFSATYRQGDLNCLNGDDWNYIYLVPSASPVNTGNLGGYADVIQIIKI